MTLVMKFGGTSVGSAEAIRSTAQLILDSKAQWHEVVVVASAMGSQPVKVTDLLLNGAHAASVGDDQSYLDVAERLRGIHEEAIDILLTSEARHVRREVGQFINRYVDLCRAVLVLGELTPRALDTIGGMGEQMSVRIVAAYLRELGHPALAIDATELIVTDSVYQNASPLLEQTRVAARRTLCPLLEQGTIPVVTGFIAADQDGHTTTLGRGGSDYSAAILGFAIGSDEVWIWTDVDGVMSADPRVTANARSIPELTYREVSELAYYGAKVLHPKTMRPVVEHGIPLRIKNTFNPEHPGTVILEDRKQSNGAIMAVTAIKNLRLFTVEGRGMLGVPGFAARTFAAVARAGKSVLLISQASSEQSICFATPAGSASAVRRELEREFEFEIRSRDIDSIRVHDPVAIVTVVGAGMHGTPGVAGRVFTTLGDSSVNVVAIAQGSSECSISMVVTEADSDEAVIRLHDLIVCKKL